MTEAAAGMTGATTGLTGAGAAWVVTGVGAAGVGTGGSDLASGGELSWLWATSSLSKNNKQKKYFREAVNKYIFKFPNSSFEGQVQKIDT